MWKAFSDPEEIQVEHYTFLELGFDTLKKREVIRLDGPGKL